MVLITIMLTLNPSLHTLFRLDGHGFGKFIKNMKMNKPFDDNFTKAMKQTALNGMSYFNFKLGFVGSDEITFYLEPLESGLILPFSGRIEKMNSLLAGYISSTFLSELYKLTNNSKLFELCPHFDCRVWQVDTFKNAIENISERVIYTLKNSRMMFGRHYLSHKQMQGLPSKVVVEKLFNEKNLDFNSLVNVDNRIGNIIWREPHNLTKEITIKNIVQTINFTRWTPTFNNLSPSQVLKINEHGFQENQPSETEEQRSC
jgi:tRNA(His) 5'-end guanylyltransferase